MFNVLYIFLKEKEKKNKKIRKANEKDTRDNTNFQHLAKNNL